MPLLNELQEKLRATHLLVRTAEEWDKLSDRVQQAWVGGDEHQLDVARKFHLIDWSSVTRNLLTDTFEGVGISVGPVTSDWGIATLSAGNRSCQPQLIGANMSGTNGGAQPRLRNFEEVVSDYNACLEHLAGATNEASPDRHDS